MFPNFISRLCHHSRRVLRAFKRRGPSKEDWPSCQRITVSTQAAGVILRSLLRLWARQYAFLLANRAKREGNIHGELLRRWVQGHAIFAAVSCAAASYDWNEERISDDTLSKHLKDIELVYELQTTTLTCSQCGRRLRVPDSTQNSPEQRCECPGVATSQQHDASEWSPFIERKDVLVWRQEQKGMHAGLHAYKVHGRYDDVTARDFLQVQLDTDYRRHWDATAVQLKVRMFANRDYVFTRRWLVDSSQKRMVIMSRSTQHAQCPSRPGLHRVMHYWSVMVIKSLGDFDQRLREAAKKLRERQQEPPQPAQPSKQETTSKSEPRPASPPATPSPPRTQQTPMRPTAVTVGWHRDSKLQ
ncbi:hypothetical protein B566_EDAN003956 [Ephemera danica]|nr:hypothetical protein B566_EDAN003956 [Ephemera danica]